MGLGRSVALLLVMSFVGDAQRNVVDDERGWVMGTAVFIRETDGVTYAANVDLILACRGTERRVRANENGDYNERLEPCRYKLIEVVATDGKKLRISPKQLRTLVVSRSGTTRFDVMLSR